MANPGLLSKANVLLHFHAFFMHVYEGVFPVNLKDKGKAPLHCYFVTKGRILTLMAPIYCCEDLSLAGIENSTHHNFPKFQH